MKCPNCGSSNIIWDFQKGYCVCSSCGLVIEPIYEELYLINYERTRYVELKSLSVREAVYSKKSKVYEMNLRNKEALITLYEKAASRARKNVVVDLESLKNRSGRVYHHVKDRELHELLKQDVELRKILNDFVDNDPILSSRTFRGKVAIAMIIRSIINGMYPNIEEISKITGISRTHVRRLISLVSKRKLIQRRVLT